MQTQHPTTTPSHMPGSKKVLRHIPQAMRPKRKVALSEQKVLLEENTSALLQELAMAETAQNHAIESEDYEEAETFNSTIADVQNRQSRNASELR